MLTATTANNIVARVEVRLTLRLSLIDIFNNLINFQKA
jgi:hypothetical protein